jgi:Spy/CpxP family protein refolding chaperone
MSNNRASNIAKALKGIALAAVLFGAVAAPAVAGNGGKGKRGAAIERVMQRLDLTQEQKARIKAIREQFQAQHASQIDEIRSLASQMRDARKAGDTARARALRAELKTKAEALREARKPMKEQILAVLTPAQREELAKMREELKEKRRDGRGRRGGMMRQRGGDDNGTVDDADIE